jgi:hypothetical protein
VVRIKVVVREHGRDFLHTVAEAASLDDVRDVLERLRAYFGSNGRIKIVEEGAPSRR